jgi:diguanylate cyclase (GGDEF)-like protein/PAS domain S-box-containing protein
MIVERLPEIDDIIDRFNSLNIETQIKQIKAMLSTLKSTQTSNAKIFNILLFVSTVYLILYLIYIFTSLRNNKDKLIESNSKLNDEISLREKTEQALFHLVNIDKSINDDEDRMLFLLNAICEALNTEYAFISKINSTSEIGEILGFLDHGIFSKSITYQIKGTPCAEVIENGRLVHHHDFAEYFPDCHGRILKNAVSFVGIALQDKDENILGMLGVASDSPILDSNLAENILSIASSRAIKELEHQVEINNSRRYHQGLSLIDNWIARLITEGYNEDAFFKNICLAAQDISNSQLAVFPILHKDKSSYSFLSASGGQSDVFENKDIEIDGDSICASVIMKNENLVMNDITPDKKIDMHLAEELHVNSALIVPVTLKNDPYGAIAVFRSYHRFDDIDEQLMTQFSKSVQMAIINMKLVRDIKTERERAEVTLHSIGDAVITTNVNCRVEYMNQVAESLTGWSFEEAKNRNVQDIFRIEDIDTGELFHDVVVSCLDENIIINKSILVLTDKNDSKKDIESSISPILNTSEQVEGVVIVFHDETQRRQLENTIKYQASHDPLTDLLNREAFDNELARHVHEASHNDKDHVLCYLDLDRFKLVNDTAGHTAGDQCLIQITSLIQTCIRNDDVLGRLGGDEFGLILQSCTHQNAIKITQSIIKAISEMEFRWDGCDYKLGVSIGINPLNQNTFDAADAIKKADLACYTAKDQGRGQAYVYEEKDSELIKRQEETYWATRITETIDNDRLCLFAQPIVSLKNRSTDTCHLEILVRLLDENNNLVLPAAFIPAAERYNLMHLIDRKIILETFKRINAYSAGDDVDTQFSINLSGNSLNDTGIAQYISDMAKQYDIETDMICFEITETTAIKNLQNAKSFIKDLKGKGFKFALDDFGSGLSSFQYLKNLPVDYLKIDGSFVADMVNNNIDHAMVAAINEVGHVMGIETIAEYVENDQIISKLQKLGVDYGQGYGIEQPGPLDDFLTSNEQDSPALKLIDKKA